MVSCGPDPAAHLAKIKEYLDAGFDHIYIHQVGPDQQGFLKFYADTLQPELKKLSVSDCRVTDRKSFFAPRPRK